jgi:hypothetical protein
MSKLVKAKLMVIATVAVALTIGGATTVANAAEPNQASPTSGSAPVAGTLLDQQVEPMTADCADLSASAATYILDHNLNLCGISNSKSLGGVHPDNVVSGDCGSSSLYIRQGSSSGKAKIEYGFSSAEGPMVERILDIYWDGSLHSGEFTDTFPMLSTTYTTTHEVTTGTNGASADMEGSAETVWGLVCFMGAPHDSFSIN